MFSHCFHRGFNVIDCLYLDYKVDDDELRAVFSWAGKVISAKIWKKRDGTSRGLAVVEMGRADDAQKVIYFWNNISSCFCSHFNYSKYSHFQVQWPLPDKTANGRWDVHGQSWPGSPSQAPPNCPWDCSQFEWDSELKSLQLPNSTIQRGTKKRGGWWRILEIPAWELKM